MWDKITDKIKRGYYGHIPGNEWDTTDTDHDLARQEAYERALKRKYAEDLKKQDMASQYSQAATEAQFKAHQAMLERQIEQARRAQEVMKGQGINRHFNQGQTPKCSTCPLYRPSDTHTGNCLLNPKAESAHADGCCAAHPIMVAVRKAVEETAAAEYVAQRIGVDAKT